MNRIFFRTLLSFIFAPVLAFAIPAQDETYFFKLSKSLRGVPPSMDERTEFTKAQAIGQTQSFLQGKIQSYMQDEKFDIKLKQKIDELLRFKPQVDNTGLGDQGGPSFDRFVFNVIKKNLSWDQLLLGKQYTFSDTNGFQFPPVSVETRFFNIALLGYDQDATFEEILLPKPSPLKMFRVTFPDDDQRVAGMVTTPRFFSRYVNTALNKNRRRAAAIFRIFLCDSMFPSSPTGGAQGEDQDFDTIFPDHQHFTEDQIRQRTETDIHGTLPDCKACHYKLDPLGQTFGFSAASLSPIAAPGALRYKSHEDRVVDIPLRGLGDMATVVTQQPEYEKCQVQHFWNWYVGKDLPLTRKKEQELITKFNQVGRKPRDFISYLIQLPEFKEKPIALTEDQLLARRAVRVMKNCNDCHDTQDEDLDMQEWDMTDLPYGPKPFTPDRAIAKIKKALDMDHDGARAKMPPKDSLWKLSTEDFALLKKWVQRGAPDFSGKPQVTPETP